MSVRLQSLIVVFHKAHVENLVAMVVGITYARRVSLPAVAAATPLHDLQIEGRVQRFERLLCCPKFVPLEVLQPIATRLLRHLGRQPEPLLILLDRSMINDTLNLLHLSVAYGGRALPLGWVRVPHDGTPDLALQQRLLRWLKPCLPRGVEVFLVADREFHSIHLAQWIAAALPCHFVLRLQANTWVEVGGQWHKAGALARRGERHFYGRVRVTRDRRATRRVHLAAIWEATQDEPWLLMSDAEDLAQVAAVYGKRYGIEVASRQEAKSFELRAAISLSRLYKSQGRWQEARDTLEPSYGWFTEGFTTADLQEARSLIATLQTFSRDRN